MEIQELRDAMRDKLNEAKDHDFRWCSWIDRDGISKSNECRMAAIDIQKRIREIEDQEAFSDYMAAQRAAAERYASYLNMDAEAGARQYAESEYSNKFRKAWNRGFRTANDLDREVFWIVR